MDLYSVLEGLSSQADSRPKFDAALQQVFAAIDEEEADVASILNTLAHSSPGILEVVLTSRTYFLVESSYTVC